MIKNDDEYVLSNAQPAGPCPTQPARALPTRPTWPARAAGRGGCVRRCAYVCVCAHVCVCVCACVWWWMGMVPTLHTLDVNHKRALTELVGGGMGRVVCCQLGRPEVGGSVCGRRCALLPGSGGGAGAGAALRESVALVDAKLANQKITDGGRGSACVLVVVGLRRAGGWQGRGGGVCVGGWVVVVQGGEGVFRKE